MSTERTPFVTDQRIEELVLRGLMSERPLNMDYREGAMDVRALYEAELARKDAEIEALREQLNTAFHG